MAVNGASASTQTLIPIFDGQKYEIWAIKMRTLLQSQDLWDFVEDGFDEKEADKQKLKESKKKDARALCFLQQSLSESLFSRIASATTSKEAWQTLKTEFQGSEQVIAIKLQSLRTEFSNLKMQKTEGVQDYLSQTSAIVTKMKSYGEKVTDQIVVEKVLRTLTDKFEHVVPAIMEAHNLSTYSFDALMSSLQTHEERLNGKEVKHEEKAF